MERRSVQYSLRLPPDLHRDAVDLSLVFGLSLNRFIALAIESYVAAQLRREPTLRAVERIREARSAGPLDPAGDTEVRQGSA